MTGHHVQRWTGGDAIRENIDRSSRVPAVRGTIDDASEIIVLVAASTGGDGHVVGTLDVGHRPRIGLGNGDDDGRLGGVGSDGCPSDRSTIEVTCIETGEEDQKKNGRIT